MNSWQQPIRVGSFIPVLADCSHQENCQNNKLPTQQGGQELNVFRLPGQLLNEITPNIVLDNTTEIQWRETIYYHSSCIFPVEKYRALQSTSSLSGIRHQCENQIKLFEYYYISYYS